MNDRPIRIRAASRILVIDEGGRVLLFLTKVAHPQQAIRWITPGGGVDAGESHHDAACRELFEETGMVVDDLGDPVWTHDFAVENVGDDFDRGHSEYYLLRTTAFTPSDASWTPEEHVDILEHRWWTVDDLSTTSEEFLPAELIELVTRFTTPIESDADDR